MRYNMKNIRWRWKVDKLQHKPVPDN